MSFWRRSLLALIGLGLSACASPESLPRPIPPEPALEVRVEPIIAPDRADFVCGRAVIFSFQTTHRDRSYGAHLADEFHQMLLARRFSRVTEVRPEALTTIQEAIQRAQALKYDLAVLVRVEEFMPGGWVAATRITADVRVIDVLRRTTLWYLRGQAVGEGKPSYDYLVVRTEAQPAPPPENLMRLIMIQFADRLVSGRLRISSADPFAACPPLRTAHPAGEANPGPAPIPPLVVGQLRPSPDQPGRTIQEEPLQPAGVAGGGAEAGVASARPIDELHRRSLSQVVESQDLGRAYAQARQKGAGHEAARLTLAVRFGFNSAALDPRDQDQLKELAKLMLSAEVKGDRFLIVGHSDTLGNDKYNLDLSRRRAEAVKAFLVKQGVAAERLEVRGLGKSLPLVTSGDRQAQALNRRVDFIGLGR